MTVLLREDRGRVAWLTMNRPTARNALSMDLMDAMLSALDAIEGDDRIGVVVIGVLLASFLAIYFADRSGRLTPPAIPAEPGAMTTALLSGGVGRVTGVSPVPTARPA